MDLTIFRVDGARIWGLSMGHLTRACQLANVLQENGQEVLFVMKKYPEGVDYARARGFDVEVMALEDDEEDVLSKLIDKLRPSSLVMDLPTILYRKLFSYCRKIGICTVVFDSRGGLQGEPDHVINDAIAPELTHYPDIGSRTTFRLGPDWAVLPSLPKAYEPKDKICKLLVTMGGSDPAGLTVKILESLGDLLGSFETTVVLGPFFEEDAHVNKLINPWPSIQAVKGPPDFHRIMADSDLVFSAGGRTLYALAALGRPVVVIPSIGHEDAAGKAMEKAVGFVNVDLWKDGITPTLIRNAVIEMMPLKRRMLIYEAGPSLVDGNGIERIVNFVWNEKRRLSCK